MLNHPLENRPIFMGGWAQLRPKVSQAFGLNPQIYKQFTYVSGDPMKGHNGVDYSVPVGTPIFASFDGRVRVKDSGDSGYGLHIKLRTSYRAREVVNGHLSKVTVKDGAEVDMGDLLGFTGNTGFSSGPHLHFGLRHLLSQSGDVFNWEASDYYNGYFGYKDHSLWTITYKGTEDFYSLYP